MSAAAWSALATGIGGFLTGLGALLHSMATRRQLNRHQVIGNNVSKLRAKP